MPDDDATRFEEFTEQQPATGAVNLGEAKSVLSEGLRWFEDGMHVIQSTEFDVSAEDPDPDQVVEVFIENLLDFYRSLYALLERDEATEYEREELDRLGLRLAEIWVADHDYQRRKRNIVKSLRNRGEHSGDWQQRATVPPASSLPSPA